MKLHKDGTLEGTPQEIAEYNRMTAPTISYKPFELRDTGTVPWSPRQTPDTLISRVIGTTSSNSDEQWVSRFPGPNGVTAEITSDRAGSVSRVKFTVAE